MKMNPLFLTLFLLTGIFFLNFTVRIIFAPLMPTIMADMSFTPDDAGSFFLIIASGYFISLFSSGFVSSVLKHKKTISLNAVAGGTAIIIAAMSQNLLNLKAGLFILGLSTGLYLPSGMAMLTACADQKNWGKVMGIHEMAPNLSFLLIPVLCEGLLLWMSWRSVLILFGAASILFGMAFYFFYRAEDFPGQAPKISALKYLMSTPSFWMMMVLFSLGVAGTLGVYSMLPLYLVKARGMVQAEANTLITLSRILTLFMALLAGWITDRMGEKRTLACVLLVTGAQTLSIGLFTGPALKMVIFLQPLAAVCFFPPAFAALSRICAPEYRNVVISFNIPAAFWIGGGLVPNIIGLLGEKGYFHAGFILFGALVLSGAFIPGFLKLMKPGRG